VLRLLNLLECESIFDTKIRLERSLVYLVLIPLFVCSRGVRKSIARVLTVLNQNQRNELCKFYANKKFVPLDLRPKKTRAMRRRLTAFEASRVTARQRKNAIQFSERKFALKA
jgi:large subunit ribosomal protein L35e